MNSKFFTLVYIASFSLFFLTGCKEEKKELGLSVSSIHDVKANVEEILKTEKAEDVLVVFDVDMTLTQPDHPATYYPALKKYYESFKNVTKNLTHSQRDIALTLTTKLPQRLIENDSPMVVKAMQDKGISVIAFTASLTGHRNDHVNKTIFKRRDKLQSLGFNFSFPGRVVSYMDFPIYNGGYPTLYHGVLCSNGEGNEIGKGKVLSAFLRQIGMQKGKPYGSGYTPKVVVMVDDKKANINDVQKVLEADFPEIQFIGIEYKGAFDYAPKDISEAEFTKFWTELADQAKQSHLN